MPELLPDNEHIGDLTLALELAPQAGDSRLIAEGVFQTVASLFGTPQERRPFSIFARTAAGMILGGVNARIAFGDLHVDQLWCAHQIRGHGCGSLLLRRAEQYGREQRADRSLLNTFDPGLLGFYEKRGYSLLGVVPGLAARHPVYFLLKPL
jgi:GNAT superfamily N-acetyltransferase